MDKRLTLAIKGALMGTANVIPGVSGGTVALLTGIFAELIRSIRSIDLEAARLLLGGRFRAFAAHVNLEFFLALGVGVLVSVLSVARLLEYLFAHHAFYVWSFFFGMILASVVVVLRTLRGVNVVTIGLFLVGTAAAASLAFLAPAQENSSPLYLLLCGAVAMCSMILPGLSGSYVLLLMGNYQLVMIDAVVHLRLGILIPVVVGAGLGLLAFARVLTWVFKRYYNQTIAVLTGFIFGSLSILWPWKTTVSQTFSAGGQVREEVVGYAYHAPTASLETVLALAVMAAGAGLVLLLELGAARRSSAAAPPAESA